MSQDGEDDDARQQVWSAMVVINSVFDGRPTTMGEGLFATVAQALFDTLTRTDDDNVLQDGLECLTYVVRKDVGQLIEWCVSSRKVSGLKSISLLTLFTYGLLNEQARCRRTERPSSALQHHRYGSPT